MRTRWHEEACSAPHIIIDQRTKNIRCQSCSSSPCLDELVASLTGVSPVPSIPTDEESGNLGLFWPSSVPYTRSSQGPSLADGETGIRKGERVPDVAFAHRASTSPIYEYSLRPNELRLLRLSSSLGGDRDSPVHADLNTYNYDDCPDYETVSYTWGGEEDDSILCKPVFIGPYWDVLLQTKNCWAMLKLIRPPSGQRVVWVDAICINQSNFTEREDQIAKMCQIYENSMRVFVFLGDDIVHTIGNASYPRRLKMHELPREPMNSDFLSPGDSGLFTLNYLLKRRYFNRIWVVQEMILSRRAIIRIGSAEYWVDHQTSRDIANEDPRWDWGSTAAPWFQHASQPWVTAEDQIGLLGLMRLTWECQSTDPRDKVFGVLGLDQWVPPIRPDYSISLQHVFIGIFAHCLINLRDTRVLSIASGIHEWDDYPSWVPAWKSPTGLPEPADPPNDVLNRWSLEWKREFVRQIDRSRFELERLRARLSRLGQPSRFEIFSRRERPRGYYQKYWLQEDSEDLKARDQWDMTEYSMVQFLPILEGPERSEQQQQKTHFDRRGEKHHDTILGMNTTVGTSDERPWHKIASVSADTGSLLVPLIHLHCIQYKASLVSQIEGLRCYRVSSRPPDEDSESDVSITSESGDLTMTEQPEKLDDDGSYLFFTTRTADLDNLITAGQDHLFILDKGSSPPVFLILREIDTGIFSLVASCEEVLYTHISRTNDVVGGIRLRDIRKTWDMAKLFRDIASGACSGAGKKVVREIRQLCRTFLGEPSFEDLCAVAQACDDDDNLLDVYIRRMGKHDPKYIHTGSGLRVSDEVVEVCLDHEVWLNKRNLLQPSEVGVKVDDVYEWWRDDDGTWKRFKDEWPGDSRKDLFVRAEVSSLLESIRASLQRLNFFIGLEMDDAEEPETHCSPPFSELSATGWIQPWSIPCLPEAVSHIEKDFEFDGSCYHIRII